MHEYALAADHLEPQFSAQGFALWRFGTLLQPDALDAQAGGFTDHCQCGSRRDDQQRPFRFFGQGSEVGVAGVAIHGICLGIDGKDFLSPVFQLLVDGVAEFPSAG